jgi:hypothetical protein
MKVFLIAATVLGVAISPAAASPQAAKPLVVRGGGLGHLVMPGDRAIARYTVYSGSKAVRGTFFLRNDLQKTFARLPLRRSNNYNLRVPNRLIRGHHLFYYAVFSDPRSGRSLKLPAAGARAPSTTWILEKPVVVRLGTHNFDHTRAPDAVVARARANEVGWDINEAEGIHLGPQTLQVGADGSAWLEDSFNNRLLVWNPGHPDDYARSVPVPYGAGISDVAFGPAGTLYMTRVLRDPKRLVLDRLNATTGAVLWEARVAGAYQGGPGGGSYPLTAMDASLRLDPDGTLYCTVDMGGEWGWMPVATPAAKPLSPADQLRGIHWPFRRLAGGLRLVGGELYTPRDDMAPHELRYALIDRRDRVVRAWRILSATEMNFRRLVVPDLVGGDPVVVVDFFDGQDSRSTWEYEVLRLGRHGTTARFSLSHATFGDDLLPDLRVGPDGKLYQLATSVKDGVVISRFSLGGGTS